MTSFNKFDKNGDGRISCSELSALMQQLDPSWSGGDLTKLMAQADDNGDGTLDPEEFVQFVFSPSR
ncbi:CML10 [Symbiodinium necroappetens]|uniref:CML10 protein n=1 Tax=Symbiodinium necroappetens TaxID=1628268 RepID=A0A812WBF5_9DINO|nr:CML10 [Symbiodinium necroappetens]